MASFIDTVKVLREFGNAFDISNVEAASKTASPAPAVNTGATGTRAYEIGKKVGQAVQGGGGFLSKLLRNIPGLALGSEALTDAAEGNTAGATARGALALGSVAGGTPGRALAGGFLGGELAAQGVATFADIVSPQKSVLTPGFEATVQKAGGAAKYSDDVQAKMQVQADVAAQKADAARVARVEQAMTAAPAQATAGSDRYERRMDIEKAIARLERPDEGLFRGGFAALPQLFAQTMGYVSKRGQLNRLAKQEFASEEKQLDRESTQGIEARKILAKAQEALLKPDYKIATVKSGLSEQPVVLQNGQPIATLTLDDKNNVTAQPVRARPTTAQAHAEAKAKVEASPNKEFTKQQINKRLQELGYPTLP